MGRARLLLVLVATACGCLPRTTVTQNPGPHDKGIRYYRPKPYLFVQPAADKADGHVTLSLHYLPDFSEEYSIRVRSGLGTNATKIKLDNGWNLTEINQDLDSQFDDNVNAVANLLESAGGLTRPTGAGDSLPRMVVEATNVPLGFYESVVSRGSDQRKRLYGWRYVGFHPFHSCPIQSCGIDCDECHGTMIYALVFRRGVMVFEPLHEVSDRHAQLVRRIPAPDNAAAGRMSPVEMQLAEQARAVINTLFSVQLESWQVVAKLQEDRDTFLITVTAPRKATERMESEYQRDQRTIDQQLSRLARTITGESNARATVAFLAREQIPAPR